MMKRSFSFFFLILFAQQFLCSDDATQSKKLALEIIATLSEDIVALVESKQANNSELTKVCVVQLITNLADTLANLIINIKERKKTRNFNDELSDAEYTQILQGIISRLCNDLKTVE